MEIDRNKKHLIGKETFYRMVKVALFVLVFAFFQIVCIEIILYILFYYEKMTADDLKVLLSLKITIWDILFFSIIEELIFRKWILNFLLKRKIKYSNAIQALIFALAHIRLIKIPGTFLSGLLYGNVYQKEKRVIYPILLHLFKNFVIDIIDDLVAYIKDYSGLFGLVMLLCISVISSYSVWRNIDMNLFRL